MKTSPLPSRRLQRLALMCGLLALPGFVLAQPITFNQTAAGTYNWGDANNWTGGVPDGVGVAIQKISGTNSNNLTQNIVAGATVGSILLGGSAGNTWLFNTTNALNLNNGGSGASITVNSSSTGGRLNFSTGTLNLQDNLTVRNISYNSTTSVAGAIALTSVITGNGNITLINSQNDPVYSPIRLDGTNTFNGTVTVAKGLVSFNKSASFGAASNEVIVGSTNVDSSLAGDATLVFNAVSGVNVANKITIAAGGVGNATIGASLLMSGNATFSTPNFNGQLVVNDDVTLLARTIGTGSNAMTVTFGGVVSGAGNVTVLASAADASTTAVHLTGNNTFTGDTRITSGTLRIGASAGTASLALAKSTVDLHASDTGVVKFGLTDTTTITSATFGGLTGSRNLELHNINATPAAVALRVGNNDQNTQYDGVLSSTGSLEKIGSGTLTLTAAQTYTGATTISQGALKLGSGASLAAGSAVTIGSAGTLTGTGTVYGSLAVDGTISPGNSPGTLTVADMTLNPTGRYVLDLASNGTTGSAGTEWDQIVVNGVLDLTNLSSANPFTIEVVSYTNPATPGALGSFNPGSNYTWGSVITFGSLNGTFSSDLFTFDTSNFANAFTGTFSLDQQGNALNLNYTAPIPEPSTWAAILGALALAGVMWRRRHRA